MSTSSGSVLDLVAQIVSTHCANSTVEADALPALIHQVYSTLTGDEQFKPMVADKPVPVVHPKKSIYPAYIVCLENGLKLKMLKRHLKTSHGMTPQRCRKKWDLPFNCPMTAPSYVEHRSTLAREIGLGRRPEAEVEADSEVEPEAPSRREGTRA